MPERMQNGGTETSPEHAAILAYLERSFESVHGTDDTIAVGKVDPEAIDVGGADVRLRRCGGSVLWCVRLSIDDGLLKDYRFGEKEALEVSGLGLPASCEMPPRDLAEDVVYERVMYSLAFTDWMGTEPIPTPGT